ncbi:hypothetical protein B0H17DRAFT_1150322 [Mycena rosella]|uniref:Uncharacterized protein n=1 Tax=Mycena rosella TaxID=1033263 RepID=A0AAD7BV00_MYCRO|nr:hypothetical protein B0H17DRAFT_1150322 [Mycena rosella]
MSTLEIDIPCDREKTWAFTNKDLLASWHSLWSRLLGDSSLQEKFLVSQKVIPRHLFGLADANTAIEQSITNRNACRICRKLVKDPDRQAYVGEHIMKALHGIEDSSAKVPNARKHIGSIIPTASGGVASWLKKVISTDFIEQISISPDEQLGLKIPAGKAGPKHALIWRGRSMPSRHRIAMPLLSA